MISVCMATYNGEHFIKQQIDSILPQLSVKDELIISDDGSSDGTLDIIDSYKDSRIKVLHHQKNTSLKSIKHSRSFFYVTENFENALKVAMGDYIFLSDQDDIWKNGRVKKMLHELEEYDCVMCNYSVIDSDSVLLCDKYYNGSPIKKSLLQNILASKFIGCCMAFNRSVLSYALPFPDKLLAHDFWIGCLANKKYKFTFLEEPLHFYRRTGTNVSPSVIGSQNSLLYKISYRVTFSFQIYKHILKKNISQGRKFK